MKVTAQHTFVKPEKQEHERPFFSETQAQALQCNRDAGYCPVTGRAPASTYSSRRDASCPEISSGSLAPSTPSLSCDCTLLSIQHQDFRTSSHPHPSRTHSCASMMPCFCHSPEMAVLSSPMLSSSALQSTKPLLHLSSMCECPQQSRDEPVSVNPGPSPKHSHWECPVKVV